jgi:hypothetical protein
MILLLLVLVLTGCAQGLVIQVDSIAAGEAGPGQSYVLLNNMANVSEDDLYFREFSNHVHNTLYQRGFRQAASANDAKIKIYFNYGVTAGATQHYVTSTPIYDWVGGDVATRRVIKQDASGKTVSRKTEDVYLPYRERVVGYDRSVHSYTPYTSHVILDARNAASDTPIWKITVTASGDPSGDLRRTMPILLEAGAPWIARDTKGVMTVKVKKRGVEQ